MPINIDEMMTLEQNRFLKRPVVDGFVGIAGCQKQISALREMISLPLMYPSLFKHLSLTPPKGVLFHGPPGTGKTLLARTLASSISGRPIAFFHRKGGDVLSKWVGESERTLKCLFEQARKWAPSIIFFDEIDGLAPVRSSKQDQIHVSVVSTLLALMDGLDTRGEVVVIGATNRIDNIDPALRRPGRFDREFYFGLPDLDTRRAILLQNMTTWSPGLTESEIHRLAVLTRGYNGADVKALCIEAGLCAIRRTFPAIYGSSKFKVDVTDLHVAMSDFGVCLKSKPSTERTSDSFARTIPLHLSTLLRRADLQMREWFNKVRPVMDQVDVDTRDYLHAFSPRLAILGSVGNGQDVLGSAMVAILEEEGMYVRTVGMATTEVDFVAAFLEVRRHRLAALYLPAMHSWWYATDSKRDTFLGLLDEARHSRVVVVMTMEWTQDEMPTELGTYFCNLDGRRRRVDDWRIGVVVGCPDDEVKREFFTDLMQDVSKRRSPVSIPLEPPTLVQIDDIAEFNHEEIREITKEYETHKQRARGVYCAFLRDLKKSFKWFYKPDYWEQLEGIKPIDLSIMEDRARNDCYEQGEDFLKDIDIVRKEVVIGSDTKDQKHLKRKGDKMGVYASELVDSMTKEFVRQCRYFYLFKRSNLKSTKNTKEMKIEECSDLDEIPQTQFSELGESDDELVINPTSQRHRELSPVPSSCIYLDKEVLDYLENIDLQLAPTDTTRAEFVTYLIAHTPSYSLHQLEDLGAAVASQVLASGAVDINQLKDRLGLDE